MISGVFVSYCPTSCCCYAFSCAFSCLLEVAGPGQLCNEQSCHKVQIVFTFCWDLIGFQSNPNAVCVQSFNIHFPRMCMWLLFRLHVNTRCKHGLVLASWDDYAELREWGKKLSLKVLFVAWKNRRLIYSSKVPRLQNKSAFSFHQRCVSKCFQKQKGRNSAALLCFRAFGAWSA